MLCFLYNCRYWSAGTEPSRRMRNNWKRFREPQKESLRRWGQVNWIYFAFQRGRYGHGNFCVAVTSSHSRVPFSLKDKRMNDVQGFEFKPDKCRWEIRLKSQAASPINHNKLVFKAASLSWQILESISEGFFKVLSSDLFCWGVGLGLVFCFVSF